MVDFATKYAYDEKARKVVEKNVSALPETSSRPIRVLGVSGSLRRFSYNRALLGAAARLVPPGVELAFFDLSSLPLYNQDLERQGPPPAAAAWTEAVRNADGLLFATPEYNYSTSAAIKNAIEWASRPHRGSPLEGKPVALMGATPGRSGTTRAQGQLRQMLAEPGALVVVAPEVYVSGARLKFDENRNLTDRETEENIRALLEALCEAIPQSKGGTGESGAAFPTAS